MTVLAPCRLLAPLLIVASLGLVGCTVDRGPAPPVNEGPHTYLPPVKGQLTFGRNRLVNACNVLPTTQVDPEFGRLDSARGVIAEYSEVSVPEADLQHREDLTTCHYSVLGGTVDVVLGGYPDAESARTALKAPTGTDVAAVVTVPDQRSVSVVGSRANYVYSIDVQLIPVAQAKQSKLTAVGRSLARRLVRNIDDPEVASTPARVQKLAKVDACAALDANIWAQQLSRDPAIAESNRVPDSTKVSRTYVEQTGRIPFTSSSCRRTSRFLDTETAAASMVVRVDGKPGSGAVMAETFVRERALHPGARDVPGRADAYSYTQHSNTTLVALVKPYVVTLTYQRAWTEAPTLPAEDLLPTLKAVATAIR